MSLVGPTVLKGWLIIYKDRHTAVCSRRVTDLRINIQSIKPKTGIYHEERPSILSYIRPELMSKAGRRE
jgi:hypothetical protein